MNKYGLTFSNHYPDPAAALLHLDRHLGLFALRAVVDEHPPATAWVFLDEAGETVATLASPTPTLDLPLSIARALRLTAIPRARNSITLHT